MKVDVKNLGCGLFRLEPTPTVCGEFFPSHVMDMVMKDVIMKEREKRQAPTPCTRNCFSRPQETCCGRPSWNTNHSLEPKRRSYEELDALKRFGEPDGIDVHVDRPLRENFISHKDWAIAMAKYRTLEDVAKDCDWECREPMKGTDFYRSAPTCSCGWEDNENDWQELEDWSDSWDDDDADWDEWSCLLGRY